MRISGKINAGSKIQIRAHQHNECLKIHRDKLITLEWEANYMVGTSLGY